MSSRYEAKHRAKMCFYATFVVYVFLFLVALLTFGGFLIKEEKTVSSMSDQGTAHIK